MYPLSPHGNCFGGGGGAALTPPPSERGVVSAERVGAASSPPPGGGARGATRNGVALRHFRAPLNVTAGRGQRYGPLFKFCLSGLSRAMESDFYLRYYVGHKGKFGHEFLEFEFRPDGESGPGRGDEAWGGRGPGTCGQLEEEGTALGEARLCPPHGLCLSRAVFRCDIFTGCFRRR